MTTPSFNKIDNKAYYLELGSTPDNLNKTAVKGLNFIKSDSAMDKVREIWGQVVFYDLVERRYRNILLSEKPEILESKIECEDDLHEKYCFSYITKTLWDQNVLQLLKFPPEIHKEISAKIKTTEEVQAFLVNF